MKTEIIDGHIPANLPEAKFKFFVFTKYFIIMDDVRKESEQGTLQNLVTFTEEILNGKLHFFVQWEQPMRKKCQYFTYQRNTTDNLKNLALLT